MALFENFPYTNLQQLNLNWIIKKLKELENTSVLSVNGMTGEVVLYTDRSVQLPALLGDDLHNWALWRLMNGTASGIQFTETGVEWVNGQNRIKLLTTEDIPSSAGVVAVNGQTGVVVLLGSDIIVSESDNRTVEYAISSIEDSENILAGELADAQDDIDALQTTVTDHGQRIGAAETNITTLDGTVDNLSDTVSDQADDITALESTTGTLQNNVSGLQTSVNSLQSVTNQMSQTLLSHTEQLAALTGKVTTYNYSNMSVTSGALAIAYPGDSNINDGFIFTPMYITGQIVGYGYTIQPQAGSINIYIRVGADIPADTALISFQLTVIKRS